MFLATFEICPVCGMPVLVVVFVELHAPPSAPEEDQDEDLEAFAERLLERQLARD